MTTLIPLNSRWRRPQQGGIYWEVTDTAVLFVEPSAQVKRESDIYRDVADVAAAVDRGELVKEEHP